MDSSPHPLQVMVTDFRTPEDPFPQESNESDVKKPEAPSHIQLTDQMTSRTSTIVLAGIKHPAMLINSDLDIAWQNKGAIESIWQHISATNNGNATPRILDLIFDATFKHEIINFHSCVEFFLSQLLGFLSADDLHERITGMSFDRQNILSPLLDRFSELDAASELYGGYLTLKLKDDRLASYKVVALNCDEGRLLILDPQPYNALPYGAKTQQSVKDRLERIHHQPNPVLTPYFILVAKINRASMLRTELLAEDHWRLINALYQECLDRVERYGGAFGQHVVDGFIAYFLPDQNLIADPMGVIECALAMKTVAAELGRKWRISRNGSHDIDLNMGIHYEEAYVGSLPVSSSAILTSFGDGIRTADAICQLAEDGQIWATKPVINRIPPAKAKTIRFGILKTSKQNRKSFLRHTFGSVGSTFDLNTAVGGRDDELGFLPITQIFDLS